MVHAGETVNWIWDTTDTHTVTSDLGSPEAWDSGIKSGGPPFPAFSRAFLVPGTFPYHCVIHGTPGAGMFGTITAMP